MILVTPSIFYEDGLVIRASTLSIQAGYGDRAIGNYKSYLERVLESGENCKLVLGKVGV